MYVCMYACMHACMHACMYVCMYVCMYHEIVNYQLSIINPTVKPVLRDPHKCLLNTGCPLKTGSNMLCNNS